MSEARGQDGFEEVEERDGRVVLESDLERIQPCPEYVELRIHA